jgi:hypothetical protein
MDNASNNKTMAQKLNDVLSSQFAIAQSRQQSELLIPYIVPCLAHVIQLANQDMASKIHARPTNEEYEANFNSSQVQGELASLRETLDFDFGRADAACVPYTLAKVRIIFYRSLYRSLTSLYRSVKLSSQSTPVQID